MYKLTENGVIELSDAENKNVSDDIYAKKNKDYHCLAFDKQLSGYTPLNTYIVSNNPDVLKDEEGIITSLLERKEVCSLYPKLNLSLYPITKLEGDKFEIDLDNIEKHFADILKLNYEVYKTKYLWVSFGQDVKNFDQGLFLKHLRRLLKESKLLKDIYINYLF